MLIPGEAIDIVCFTLLSTAFKTWISGIANACLTRTSRLRLDPDSSPRSSLERLASDVLEQDLTFALLLDCSRLATWWMGERGPRLEFEGLDILSFGRIPRLWKWFIYLLYRDTVNPHPRGKISKKSRFFLTLHFLCKQSIIDRESISSPCSAPGVNICPTKPVIHPSAILLDPHSILWIDTIFQTMF